MEKIRNSFRISRLSFFLESAFADLRHDSRQDAWRREPIGSEGEISYANAIELLRLAGLAAARHSGVTLGEIAPRVRRVGAHGAAHGAGTDRSLPAMAWHLDYWGDSVEVVAPEALTALVGDSQRHFGVLL